MIAVPCEFPRFYFFDIQFFFVDNMSNESMRESIVHGIERKSLARELAVTDCFDYR